MSLWDIKGKALGHTPEETRKRAQRFRERGFTAVKFGWDPMGKDEKTDIALVREARKGLGDDADLMLPDDYDGYRKLKADACAVIEAYSRMCAAQKRVFEPSAGRPARLRRSGPAWM